MNCPKCDDRMLTATRAGGVEVDHCGECGGVWLDRSELGRLIEADPGDVKPLLRGRDKTLANTRHGRCPRCQTDLLRVTSAMKKQVIVDSCPDCGGVWLDGGEFSQIFEQQDKS